MSGVKTSVFFLRVVFTGDAVIGAALIGAALMVSALSPTGVFLGMMTSFFGQRLCVDVMKRLSVFECSSRLGRFRRDA